MCGSWIFSAVITKAFVQQIWSRIPNPGALRGKVHPRTGREGPEGEQMYSSTLPSTSALDGCGWSTPRHAPAVLPPRNTLYPLYKRLGGPQDLSGQVRKISPTPGFDLRTVQPVASRYSDWAIPDPWALKMYFNPLKAELSPICHLLTLLRAHLIFHVSRIRVKYIILLISKSLRWSFTSGLSEKNHLYAFLRSGQIIIFSNYRFVTLLKNKNVGSYLRTRTPGRCVKILSCHRVTLAAGCIPNRPPAGTSPPLIATRPVSATRNWLITILIDVCLDLLIRNAVWISSLRWSKVRYRTSPLFITGNYIHPAFGAETCDF